jgi:hypothetical protein
VSCFSCSLRSIQEFPVPYVNFDKVGEVVACFVLDRFPLHCNGHGHYARESN